MKMDKNNSSVLEIKRSCLVTKSVKCLLNEFQCVYGEKLRRLECEIKGSQEEILQVGWISEIKQLPFVFCVSIVLWIRKQINKHL